MNSYQICSKCVMDTSAPDITFKSDGTCCYCNNFIDAPVVSLVDQLDEFIKQIKSDGKRLKYDCIVGLSGGVDSSYVLHKAVNFGLRPLAVHMNNNWNSEQSNQNIYKLVTKLNVDLFTYVVEWNEYKSLMSAFMAHNLVDIELLTDNAMLKVNYMLANKYNIKYILSGFNSSTEGMPMPYGWNTFKYDKKQIKYLAKTMGIKRLKSFPAIGTFEYVYYRFVRKINWTPFLNYFIYNKEDAISELEREYGFKRYQHKHYESIFTRFYQGYILPKKFLIDKRRLHFSNLICSGQMNRKDALSELAKSPYNSTNLLQEDLNFFIKKMDISSSEFDSYLKNPRSEHNDFPSEEGLWKLLLSIKSFFYKVNV